MIKPTAKVKQLYSVVQELSYALSELVDSREETYNGRSDKWQESDNGFEFEQDTSNLQTVVDTLENLETELADTFEF